MKRQLLARKGRLSKRAKGKKGSDEKTCAAHLMHDARLHACMHVGRNAFQLGKQWAMGDGRL